MKEALSEEKSSSMTFSLFSMGSMKTDKNAEQERTVASGSGPLANSSQSLRECLELQQELDSADLQVVEKFIYELFQENPDSVRPHVEIFHTFYKY